MNEVHLLCVLDLTFVVDYWRDIGVSVIQLCNSVERLVHSFCVYICVCRRRNKSFFRYISSSLVIPLIRLAIVYFRVYVSIFSLLFSPDYSQDRGSNVLSGSVSVLHVDQTGLI